MAEEVDGAALEAAYGVRPPELPAQVPATSESCQKALGKAAQALASGWPAALTRCERDNQTGKHNPLVDCSSDPDGRIAKAQQKAGKKIQSCDDFSGLAGCATSGDASGTQACMEAAVEAVASEFAEVAYP
jgi:hypothetical protein